MWVLRKKKVIQEGTRTYKNRPPKAPKRDSLFTPGSCLRCAGIVTAKFHRPSQWNVYLRPLTWIIVLTQEKVIGEGDFLESTECIFSVKTTPNWVGKGKNCASSVLKYLRYHDHRNMVQKCYGAAINYVENYEPNRTKPRKVQKIHFC